MKHSFSNFSLFKTEDLQKRSKKFLFMKLWEFHFLKIPFALFHEFHFLLHQSGLDSENKHKSSNSVLTCICKSGFIPLNTLSFIIFFIIKHFCLFQITTVIPHISRLFQTVHYLYLSHIIFLSFKVSKYYSFYE